MGLDQKKIYQSIGLGTFALIFGLSTPTQASLVQTCADLYRWKAAKWSTFGAVTVPFNLIFGNIPLSHRLNRRVITSQNTRLDLVETGNPAQSRLQIVAILNNSTFLNRFKRHEQIENQVSKKALDSLRDFYFRMNLNEYLTPSQVIRSLDFINRYGILNRDDLGRPLCSGFYTPEHLAIHLLRLYDLIQEKLDTLSPYEDPNAITRAEARELDEINNETGDPH